MNQERKLRHLEPLLDRLDCAFSFSFFAGYGENLLDFDQKETRARFGLGIGR